MTQHTNSVETAVHNIVAHILGTTNWEADTTFIENEIHATLKATHQQQVEEAVREGWKGYVVVDPEAGNYKYSSVFSEKKEAESWLKESQITGLKVVEVDVLLTPSSQD